MVRRTSPGAPQLGPYRGALGVLCLVAVLALPALASATTGLTIQPIKISETLAPGQETSGTILLTNASDGPVEVELSVQDFVPVGGADSIQFVARAPGLTSVKDWITVGEEATFSFAEGESKRIPYTIKTPLDAEPGGHFGVVFFKATEPSTGGSLKIGTQVGMLVLVAVPGNKPQKGEILSFTAPRFIQRGPVSFSIRFENTGTVHFEPKGAIRITNMLGRQVAEVPIAGQIVLPTSIKELNEQWPATGLLLGRYAAAATIVDGEGEVLTTETVYLWAFPIWYAAAFVATAIALFFLIRFLRSRIRITVVRR